MDESHKKTMNEPCRHFREVIEAYLLGDISSEEKKSLEGHLLSCAACQREIAKEKKLLGLFQSFESHPAPENLRIRIMEHINKGKAPRRTFFQSLDRIFSRPRIRVLTGAVAALLMVFWGIRLFRHPVEAEKRRIVDLSRMEVTNGEYAPPKEPEGREKKKAESLSDEFTIQEQAPVQDIQMEKPSSASTIASVQEKSLEYKKAAYAGDAVEERLKGFGAVQIQKLNEASESQGAQYAFFISQKNFENAQKDTSLNNIRILKVRDLTKAALMKESLKSKSGSEVLGVPSMKQDQELNGRLSDEKAKSMRERKSQAPPSEMNKQIQEATAPLEADKTQSALGGRSSPKKEIHAFDTLSEIPPAAKAAPPASAPAMGITGMSPTPEPADFPGQQVQTLRPAREYNYNAPAPALVEDYGGHITSPTLTQEEKRKSAGLTSDASLLYLEIEVEPKK